jgi:uncharacterized membrane protein
MASFFSKFDSEQIVAEIAAAEKRASGEGRGHVTRRVPKDLEARALRRFHRLGMTATAERNGVLIYIAPRARRFHVLGDVAIHEKSGPDFWKEVAAEMEGHFRKGEFTEGAIKAIQHVADALEKHFPRRPDDRDELTNQISED